MAFHFDHLAAIIVGAIVLGAVAILQQRDTASTAEATLTHGARARAEVALDVLTQDAENLLTPGQAAELGVPYAVQLWHDGARTTAALLTVFVRTGPATFAPEAVRYDLVDTGRTTVVGADTVALRRLTRRVGTEPAVVVGEDVVDLEVAAVAGDAVVASGVPPSDLTQVRLGVAVAAPTPGLRSHDQRSTSETHVVRVGVTLRPINLPPQD